MQIQQENHEQAQKDEKNTDLNTGINLLGDSGTPENSDEETQSRKYADTKLLVEPVTSENPDEEGTQLQSGKYKNNEILVVERKEHETAAIKAKTPFRKIGTVGKYTLAVAEEIIAGGSIVYSWYILFSLNKNYRSELAYIAVAAGSLTNGLAELLHLLHAIPSHKFHNYRLLKQAIAGGPVAGIFLGALLLKTLPIGPVVAINVSVAASLTISKTLLDIYRDRPFFEKKLGKALQYGLGGTFNGLVAAGIVDYLMALIEGFGVDVPIYAKYATAAVLALVNVAADLPISHFKEKQHKTKYYTLAHLVRSGIYGAELAFFLSILSFDGETDIRHSTKITDAMFYTTIALCSLQGIAVATKKFIDDNQDEHDEHEYQAHLGEKQPLLPKHEEKKLTHSSKGKGSFLTNCCYNFWNSDKAEVEHNKKLEALIEKHEEIKPSQPVKSSGYLPSMSWFSSCFDACKKKVAASFHSPEPIIEVKPNV